MFHVEHLPRGQESRSAGAAASRHGPPGPLRARGTRFRPGAGRSAGVLALAALLVLPGCAGIRSVRLYFPEASGLERVRPGVYVDPAMTAPQREAFAADLEAGRRRAAEFYGGLVSSPTIVACASKACSRRFGGVGKGISRTAGILLSPEGLNPAIVAHEWSHAEFGKRVGRLRRWWRVPQWFDEGIAVLASRDPAYTEEAWLAATDNGAKAPPLSDLETLRGWLRVTGKDGKTKQFSYGTARHTVAAWYAVAGPDGFNALIEGVRNGEDFRTVYDRTGAPGARKGCSTWNIPPEGRDRRAREGEPAAREGGRCRRREAGGSAGA